MTSRLKRKGFYVMPTVTTLRSIHDVFFRFSKMYSITFYTSRVSRSTREFTISCDTIPEHNSSTKTFTRVPDVGVKTPTAPHV